MTRPSPIAIIALCIVALAILAFTINEEFGKKKHFSSDAVPITKDANIISAIGATNPPHGQPGHRHDLPDGAPIPGDAVMPATTTSAATDLPGTNISSPTSSDAILNPAHGQPGHRCDIAVGAPLNSPKKDTNTTNSNSASLNSPVFPNYTFPGKDSSTTRTPQ